MSDRRRRTGDEAGPAFRGALHALGLAARLVMLIIGLASLTLAGMTSYDMRHRPPGSGDLMSIFEGAFVLGALLVGIIFTVTAVGGMLVEQVNRYLPKPWGTGERRPRAQDDGDPPA